MCQLSLLVLLPLLNFLFGSTICISINNTKAILSLNFRSLLQIFDEEEDVGLPTFLTIDPISLDLPGTEVYIHQPCS